MKGLIIFLLLLVCALCAVAQTQVPASHPRAQTGPNVAVTTAAHPATAPGKADIGLFAAGGAALAAFLLIWSPFGAMRRRRIGTRAELSALVLALLLCGIMAVEGCGGSSPAPPTSAAQTS